MQARWGLGGLGLTERFGLFGEGEENRGKMGEKIGEKREDKREKREDIREKRGE